MNIAERNYVDTSGVKFLIIEIGIRSFSIFEADYNDLMNYPNNKKV
jgi:hypothetical protein